MKVERLHRKEPIRRVQLKGGRVRYRVVIDVGTDANGKRRQATSTWDTLSQARDEVARVRTEVKAGTYVGRAEITVSEFLEQWLAGLHDVKPKTVIGYRDALRVVVDAHGSKPLQGLTKTHVSSLVSAMLTTGGRKGVGRSPRTVALMLTILRAALRSAIQERLVTQNVADMVRLPKSNRADEVGQAWEPEQAKAFLVQVASDRYAAAWRLSLYGLRRGEVLGLAWDAVDLDAGVVTVRETRVVAGREVVRSTTKNGKVRRVPVGPEVVSDLRAFKALQARERLQAGESYTTHGLVVVDELGNPMRPERYGDLFQAHARAAKLPRIRLHDLRHTAASLLKSKGVPMLTAASLLGHDPMIFAKVYGHDYEEDLRRASDALSACLVGGH